MDRQILNFTANEQILVCDNPIKISTNKVNYIEARFDLGQNWSGYDSVRAVWFNDFQCISTVLDSQGVTFVPFEVMKRRGNVKVNLVGSISENNVLTDRLTSYPVVAVIVDCIAQITGAETNPITPSQFEQFVQQVISEVEKVTGMTAQAETLPAGSQATARYENGILYLGIPQGIQGERGETGADGNGIAQVLYNADYSLTFVFTNGEQFRTPPIRGERGERGEPGQDGTDGRDGADGVTPNLTIGTVETLEPTQDAYVTRRGTDDNPIFDFGIPKGDKGDPGEVTMSQLSSLLPTDTASGSIASFPDGTDLFPALSVKAQIEPIQDLHGYDKPWSGGSNYNQWDEEWKNGYYTANGFYADSRFLASKDLIAVQPSTSYFFKTVNSIQFEVHAYDAEKNYIGLISGYIADNTITTDANTHYIAFNSRSADQITTYTSGIAINYPSSVTTYSPYSNICPISGHTECVTEVCGVNVWDEEWELGSLNPANGGLVPSTRGIRSKNYIAVLPNTAYYFRVGSSSAGMNVCYYDADKQFVSAVNSGSINVARTTPTNAYYMKFSLTSAYGTTYNHDISINYPSTDTSYHAYLGNTYTTALGRTVYGGTLDVVSGELVVDRAMVTLDGSDHAFFNEVSQGTTADGNLYIAYIANSRSGIKPDSVALSNSYEWVDANTTSLHRGQFNTVGSYTRFVIADQTLDTLAKWDAWLASNPMQLCYELATPQTYQLDPQTIDLLLGDNNLWTDCGSVEVVYKADIQRWVLKKLSE